MPPVPVEYQPRPYVSGNTLGQLLQLQAAHRAEAEARRGEQSAQMWANLGNTVSTALTGYAKEKAQEPIRLQETEIRANEIAKAKAETAQRTQATQANATIDGLMKGALVKDPQTGFATYDRAKLQEGFAASGIGHLWPQYAELLDKSDASLKTLRDTHHSAIQDVARLVDASGNDATVFRNELMRGVENKLFTQAEAAPYFEAAQRDPANVGKITASILGKKPELMAVNPGDAVIDKDNPGAGPVYAAPESDTQKAARIRADAQAAETARHNLAMEANAAATRNDVTDLTPAGLDMAALNYRKTGVMPALGNGDKVTRKQIIDRAAVMTPDDMKRIEVGGLDVAANRADYRADADTLKTLRGLRTAIEAFEQTAQKNIDIFLDQAKKIADTGSPLLNTPVRMVTGKLLGAPDQAAYDAARQVAVNEIAKITSNPTLAGQLSDSARHEVEAFNPANATLKQTISVMKLLKQDMQNRTSSLDQAISEIQQRIGGGAKPPADTQGQIVVTAPDGSKHPFATQAQADAFKKLAGIK